MKKKLFETADSFKVFKASDSAKMAEVLYEFLAEDDYCYYTYTKTSGYSANEIYKTLPEINHVVCAREEENGSYTAYIIDADDLRNRIHHSDRDFADKLKELDLEL